MILLFTAIFYGTVSAQDRSVSGKVTASSDGTGIPGVNVLLKGSTIGVVTDINGDYRINVPGEGGILVFSSIGLVSQEIEIGNQSVINVSLTEDVTQLSEIVVTAVGIESSKRKLGYAVQSVEASDVVKAQRTNIVDGLAGRAAGVYTNSSSGTAGASSAIRIRGSASIDGNNDPLFVIDGIPIDNEERASGNPDDESNQFLDGVANSNRAIDINPNDIESISILKGGAATALYGIRAANGAVIITTKRGGNTAGKPVVTISSSVGVNRISQMPDLQTSFSQGSGGVMLNPGNTLLPDTDINSGTSDRHSWGAPIADLRYQEGTAGLYGWDKNGRLVDKDDPTASNRPANVYDNVDDFFRTGLVYDNNVSLSVGSEKTQYYFSVGNRKEEGVVPNNNFERTSFKATMTTKFFEKLKSTASITYVRSGGDRVQQGSNLSGVMLGLLRTPPTFDNSNGLGNDAVDNPEAYLFPDGTQRGYRGLSAGPRTLQAIYDNPFFTVSENQFEDDVHRVIGFAQLDYEVLPWINVTYRLGTDFYNDSKFTGLAIGSLNLGNGEGFIANDQITSTDINSDLIISLNKDINEDISLGVIVGHNYFDRKNRRYYTQGIDIAIPGFNHITNTVSNLIRDVNTNKTTSAVYADISIGYKDFLFLGLTGRNEWSSTLPEDDNSFFYPSASLGFIFTDAFQMQSNILSFGKLRAAYSILGNDAEEYRTATTFVTPNVNDGWVNTGLNFPYNGRTTVTRSVTLGNSALRPEELTSMEFGAELRFFNNKLGLDVTWYRNLSKDQIIDVPIDPASGYREVALNAGEIENKGWEIALLASPISQRNFTWDVNVNFTKNVSEVLALAPGVEVIQLVGFASTSSRAIVGKGYGAIYGQDFERDANGNMIIGSNGYPSLDNDAKFLGDPNPDWIAGINNSLNFKGIGLSFLWDIKQGGDIWNGTAGALTTMGTAGITANRGQSIVFPGVLADGSPNTQEVVLDETWYRGSGGGFSGNAVDFIEETSWVRLRNITLSYSLPSTILERLPFTDLSFSLTGNNLILITDYSGVDPETSLIGSGNGTAAMDYFNNPGTKGYLFGIRATF